MIEKFNKTKSWLFENNNEIDQQLTKGKKEQKSVTGGRKKRGVITTDPTGTKKMIEKITDNFMPRNQMKQINTLKNTIYTN